MTVREALDRAAELRPGCKLSDETRRRWLCEEDAMLRKLYFEKSGAAGYEKVGADAAWSGSTLPDSTELLVPVPYDTLYPHFLCARHRRGAGGDRPLRRGTGAVQQHPERTGRRAAAGEPAPPPGALALVRRKKPWHWQTVRD